MANKQSFKLFLSMLAMLVSLTGCFGTRAKEEVVSPGSISGEKLTNDPQTAIPATYLLVGFAGLTDPGTHPGDWLEKIKKMIGVKTANLSDSSKTTVYTLLAKRSSENKTAAEHAIEVDQQIQSFLEAQEVEDFNQVRVILVAESYGGLVAAEWAGKNNFFKQLGINDSVAGLITIRTPWEGVDLITGIDSMLPIVRTLQNVPQLGNMLRTYNDCKGALDTMHPTGSFITELKSSGVSKLNLPVLALAGQDKDTEPTFLYKKLQRVNQLDLPLTLEQLQGIVSIPQENLPLINMLGGFVLPTVKSIISPLINPYKPNDGLVTTASAEAANSQKGTSFKSHVLGNFPHVGITTEHAQALQLVEGFIDEIVK